MPVEDVVFVHLHQIQVVLDHILGDKVSACVYEYSAVGEPWTVTKDTFRIILSKIILGKSMSSSSLMSVPASRNTTLSLCSVLG